MRNDIASGTESELGGLFENFQETKSIQNDLAEMGHSQPTTPVATYNKAANIIVKRMSKQKISRAKDMRFYLVRDRIQKNYFHIFW